MNWISTRSQWRRRDAGSLQWTHWLSPEGRRVFGMNERTNRKQGRIKP